MAMFPVTYDGGVVTARCQSMAESVLVSNAVMQNVVLCSSGLLGDRRDMDRLPV